MNHRRYEALRAVFVEGLTHAQAGERFGYTAGRWSTWSASTGPGKLELFAAARKPGPPPPGVAPAKDRARARVIELRRQGLSTYEISARLAAEGAGLNRTSVAEVLVDFDDLATLTPYITHTIRRFGDWVLDLSPPDQQPVTRLDLEPGALFPG